MQATVAGERETLEAFLDFYRDVLVHKVRGIGDTEAGRRLLPSLTTLAGLVKHLTVVERHWFHRMAGGGSEATADDEGDASWALADTDTVESLLAEYDRACALSRTIADGYALDDVFAHPNASQVSLRWIYIHMIAETARHTGHADIVRELTDGETGVLG
ncbi:DinB family protein [Frankia sp. EUN1f]|uniref:DinB family protein n=1 Tax=Parafrankia sp. EUN1f TaxID=102897 RepID=UPI0001C45660|nr:protein of unknown function DUF664 [Parafrankia sp. EUN1f]